MLRIPGEPAERSRSPSSSGSRRSSNSNPSSRATSPLPRDLDPSPRFHRSRGSSNADTSPHLAEGVLKKLEGKHSPIPHDREIEHVGLMPLPKTMRFQEGRLSPVYTPADVDSGFERISIHDAEYEITAVDQKRITRILFQTHTRFTDPELELLSKQFKRESVAHNIDSYLDVQGLRKILSTWGVPLPMVRFLFRVFDNNDSKSMEFEEYIRAMGVIVKGDFEEKLKYFFRMWDKDNSGSIEPNEVLEMLHFLHEATTTGDTEVSQEDRKLAEYIFEKLDVNHDGDISFAEFSKGAHRVPKLSVLLHTCFGDM